MLMPSCPNDMFMELFWEFALTTKRQESNDNMRAFVFTLQVYEQNNLKYGFS